MGPDLIGPNTSTFEAPSETRDSRRGGNATAESLWLAGSEQKRPMCVLVEEAVEGDMRNRHHAIRLKGLAGRKRHAGVVTNTGYEIPFVGTWLNRAPRVAEVDGGGAVERNRCCLCLKKIRQLTFSLRPPTEPEHDPGAGRDGAPAFIHTKKGLTISSATCDPCPRG